MWLFLYHVKSLSDMDCNLDITVSVSGVQAYGAVSSA